MEFGFAIYPEHRAIVARYAGSFTLADLLKTTRQLWADPRYSPDFIGLADISDSTVNVDMNDLRALTTFLVRDPATSRGRWAAVATTPIAIACGLVYRSAMRRRHAFEVFTTRDQACRFLGLDPALVAPAGPPALA